MSAPRTSEKRPTVAALMTQQVYSCRIQDSLQIVAELMRDLNCDCLPVTDDDGVLAGVVTHQDICNAAATEELTLGLIPVESAMTASVVSCRPEDSIVSVIDLMRSHRVQRLPVLDSHSRMIGLISLGTIARRTASGEDLGVDPEHVLAAAFGTLPEPVRAGSASAA